MRRTLLSLTLALTCACGGGAASGAPDISGFVTSVTGRTDGVTVLVEANPSSPNVGDKASVAVSSSIRVTRRAEGGEVSATYRDLVPGVRVEVWFDGPVATSYPVQGKARAVVIVR
jgi:Protein of unknown function (DUF3221)